MITTTNLYDAFDNENDDNKNSIDDDNNNNNDDDEVILDIGRELDEAV